MLYIRPIQMNIDVSYEDMDGTDFDFEEAENAPKVACVRCGASVPVSLVRSHHEECVRSTSTITDESEENKAGTSCQVGI